jgi:hypothetical protein
MMAARAAAPRPAAVAALRGAGRSREGTPVGTDVKCSPRHTMLVK